MQGVGAPRQAITAMILGCGMQTVSIDAIAPAALMSGASQRTRGHHSWYSIHMDPKQLLAEALQLRPEQRAALAGELIQSLDSQIDEDAEATWSAEIRRRLERLDSGSAKTVPWAEARRRILAAARR
jgi:putative addiction module component (TIGR02574 family)